MKNYGLSLLGVGLFTLFMNLALSLFGVVDLFGIQKIDGVMAAALGAVLLLAHHLSHPPLEMPSAIEVDLDFTFSEKLN